MTGTAATTPGRCQGREGLLLLMSLPGLTRQSRECRDLLDARVKPGHDSLSDANDHSSLNGPIISGSSLNQLPSWL